MIELHRAGAGEPLVAIHGLGSCLQVWEPVLPALAEEFDVLALSLPGYGRSAPLEGEPTVPALVDAVERVMDETGMEAAHLVGNSLGGWIAAELASRGRARSVVAISPAGLWTPRELDYSVAVLRASYAGARRVAPYADRIARSPLGARLLMGHVAARPELLEAESVAYQVRAFAGSPSFLRTLGWIHDGREMPRGLERIACPFRVVWGTHDLLLLPRQGRRWERIVPGAELVELPGLGHAPMGDDSELVARTITDFAARAAAAAPPAGAARP